MRKIPPTSRLLALLLPREPRTYPGQRWGNITLRTLHLIGIAGIGGGFLHGLDPALWRPFWYLTLASGGGLSLLYIAASAVWLCQLRGLVVLFKLVLLGLALHWPGQQGVLFVLIIVLSGLIAHAPGRVRGLLWLNLGREQH